MMLPILIRNGRVIDPLGQFDATADVLVMRDQIAAVAPKLVPPTDQIVAIDATGLLVVPGLVDVHVHFREPGFERKEDISTGSQAAAAGGFTSVVCEPNTDPPVDSIARARDVARRAAVSAPVRVYQKACMTCGRAGETVTDYAALIREPIIKALSDDGDPIFDARVVEEAMKAAGAVDALVSPHCEDSPSVIERREAGPARGGFEAAEYYQNETAYVTRDVQAALEYNTRLHISHVSTSGAIAAVNHGRRKNGRITCEVAPHHFALDTRVCAEKGLEVRVNPPIRTPEERVAVLDAIADGVFDVIASDHAPHTADDKAAGAHGIIGLETVVGLVSTFLVRSEIIRWPQAITMMSANPCRIFGLPGGSLIPGNIGDVTLIDPDCEWIVDPGAFASKSRNCPFAGWKLTGRSVLTICRNEIVHTDESVKSRMGKP